MKAPVSYEASTPSSIPRSPSVLSSTSDLHSYASSDYDLQRKSKTIRPPSKPRPVPKFMPRTPGGMAASLSVSGATARAPTMHAHLVVDPESPVEETAKASLKKDEVTIIVQPTHASDLTPFTTTISPVPSTSASVKSMPIDGNSEARKRSKSLSASVSSMLDQARTVEREKAKTRPKGMSSLKGSPAWTAKRRALDSANGTTSPVLLPSASSDTSVPGSKKALWIGSGLLGLGLSATPSAAGSSGHSQASSISANGVNTPPLRVSFSKEPAKSVRYSEEREAGYFDEEDVVDGYTVKDSAGNVSSATAVTAVPTLTLPDEDGALTIKARSLRRASSWNDSISARSSIRHPVPAQSSSKKTKGDGKKGGWLEWFINATAAGANASANGMNNGFGGISREDIYERREWI